MIDKEPKKRQFWKRGTTPFFPISREGDLQTIALKDPSRGYRETARQVAAKSPFGVGFYRYGRRLHMVRAPK